MRAGNAGKDNNMTNTNIAKAEVKGSFLPSMIMEFLRKAKIELNDIYVGRNKNNQRYTITTYKEILDCEGVKRFLD